MRGPAISVLPLSTAATTDTLHTIADLRLWVITVVAILVMLAVDFAITRRPHAVEMKEALGWSAFYIALPLAFGVWVWGSHGSEIGLQYYTGYLVEKSLSVDNLFIFILILTAFAVPRALQQRVLLIGIIGALVLRTIFIAVGAVLISRFSIIFLVFGAILLVTAWGVLKDALSDDHEVDVQDLKAVKLAKRFWPVTDTYQGTKLTVAQQGRRALTPLGLVALAILGTDIVFAIDSVPAVYGITGDPYLVFITNAFALLGLRALYFVLQGALGKLRYLGYGLALILAFIAVKLVLHWAHTVWPEVPGIPTVASLIVIVVILVATAVLSLWAERRDQRRMDAEDTHVPLHSDDRPL